MTDTFSAGSPCSVRSKTLLFNPISDSNRPEEGADAEYFGPGSIAPKPSMRAQRPTT